MLFAATWMDLEVITLSEVSQRKKVFYGITFMWNQKMTQMNLFIKQKQTHTHKAHLLLPEERQEGAGLIRSIGLTIG